MQQARSEATQDRDVSVQPLDPRVERERETDVLALERFRAGDTEAFGELFTQYQWLAVGYARKFTSSLQDAEDLAQDAFAKVLRALKCGKGPLVSMRFYLLTAVRTIAIDRSRRKESQEITASQEELASLWERSHFGDEYELADWVVEGFNALPERQQFVVWQHAIEGRSFTSIAPELDISLASASRDYSRAMKQLRSTFARCSANASPDPVCALFADQLNEPAKSRSVELSEHLESCANCRAIVKRLNAKDPVLLGVILLAGLGGLGLSGLRPAAPAAALAARFGAASLATKVTTATLLLGAFTGALMLGTGFATWGGDTGGVAGSGGTTAESEPVLVSVNACEVRRIDDAEGRQVWQLYGRSSCAAVVERVASDGDRTKLLDTATSGSAIGLEIVRTGEYRIEVSDGSKRKETNLSVESGVNQR